MHHKRKGPKSTRAGCLMCKPHKHQAFKDCGGTEWQRRKYVAAKDSFKDQLREVEEK